MSANQAADRLRRRAGAAHPAPGITAFLVIAFGLAWAIWLPMWVLGVPSGSAPAQAAQVVGSFSPAVAAVIVRRWVTCEGFADAGLRPPPAPGSPPLPVRLAVPGPVPGRCGLARRRTIG